MPVTLLAAAARASATSLSRRWRLLQHTANTIPEKSMTQTDGSRLAPRSRTMITEMTGLVSSASGVRRRLAGRGLLGDDLLELHDRVVGRVAEGPGDDPLDLEPGPVEQAGVVGEAAPCRP